MRRIKLNLYGVWLDLVKHQGTLESRPLPDGGTIKIIEEARGLIEQAEKLLKLLP